MNNIEILEEHLNFIKNFDNNSSYIPALENLIQENKELKKYRTYYDNAKVVWSRNDYISKDKIREYLNKMEKRCNKPKFSIMKKEIEELLED